MVREGLAARVHACMDGDAAAREILARGALSLRAMARWLIKAHAWEHASEEAVVSALRRYPATRPARVLPDARRVLARGHVNMRGNVCALTIAKAPGVHRGLGRVMDLVDPLRGDVFRVIEGERAITVIAGDVRVEDLRAHLPTDTVRDVRTRLVEYDLVLPAAGRQTAGVLALVSNTLAVHGIHVAEAVTCGAELLILVHEGDARRTFQALARLTTNGVSSPRSE